MHTLKRHKIWISVVVLALLVAGCGDSDKNSGAGDPGAPLTPPTVRAVTPPDAVTLVCPTNVQITATFSKPMNPATLNVLTFKVTGPNAASVAGTVTYIAATKVAIFTPTSSLAPSTTYTATLTTDVADEFGIRLAANFVWTFATSAVCAPAGQGLVLGAACSFGILAATPSVTSIGPTNVTGDVGVWPAAAINGFPPGTLTGTTHLGDSVAMTAQGDLTAAYNVAAAAPGGAVLTADIGGQTLPAGVYRTTSAQPSLGITGNLTLNGGGDPNAVWIFQIVSSLTTATGNSQVILSNSANSQNVFWQIGSSATLGTNTTFTGTVMAQDSITLTTGATLNGRALARTGAVTLDSNPVNVPACP